MNEINKAIEDTQHGRYLTFSLGGELFGVEIRHVTEIVGMQDITPIPETPDYIKGIINLRGKIIPVLNVRTQFQKEEIPYSDRTCIIVIDINALSVGLIVDNVDEVLLIDDDNISPPPSSKTGFENRYMKGIGKANGKIQLLLDAEKLLKNNELEVVEEIVNNQ